MARPKVRTKRILLPLTPIELEALDAGREEGEARTDLIRKAIVRELARRWRRG